MVAPTTSFEDSSLDNPEWISLSEEQAFLQDVVDQSGRTTLINLGPSAVDNNPINLVAVGYPDAPTEAELRGKSNIFIMAAIHGNEPSGREAALQKIRDLAFSEDPAVQDYLRQHPVMFVPTANPDNADIARVNKLNNDLNRQWLDYADAENHAIGKVIRDYDPHIMLDLHEKNEHSSNQFDLLHPINDGVDSAIADMSEEIQVGGRAALGDAGFTTGLYPGTGASNLMSTVGGLQNILTVLFEVSGQGSTKYLTRKQALSGLHIFLDTVIDYHRDNLARVHSTVSQAKIDNRQAGEDQAPIVEPPISAPLGYTLTNAQYAQIEISLDRHRLRAIPLADGTGYYVPMAQAARRLIPFIMDPIAQYKVVSATAETTEPALSGQSEVYNIRWRKAGEADLVGAEMARSTTDMGAFGLEPETSYEWEVQSQISGQSSNWSGWEQFTTTSTSTPGQIPQGTIAIGTVTKDHESATVEFTYNGDDASSFEYRVNGGIWATVTSPISLSDLSELTQYAVLVRPVNEYGTGTVEDVVFTTDEAPAAPQTPQGTVTVGTITVDHESVSIPFSYNDTDQTGFEYSTNGSTWTAVTSPLVFDNLNPETTYSGQIRAVNADGSGQATSYSFTTEATEPRGLITFGTASVAATSWSLPFSYSMDDADGFEYRINGGNWIDAISPVSMYNADPETSYTVDVRPYNAQGTGNVLSAIITTTADNTDPQPDETIVERVYTIEAYKNRMPDTQRFAMYQGDRVRLLVEHNFDLAGKQLLFRLAPKKGAPARFTLTSENDQFVITSAMAEELAVSNKVWQLILKENESRVVVGEGAVDIRYRIKE